MTPVATSSSRSSFDSLASSNPPRRQYTRLKKKVGINGVDEVWADVTRDLPTSLDKCFINVKKRLVAPENNEAVQASWDRLLIALEGKAKIIEVHHVTIPCSSLNIHISSFDIGFASYASNSAYFLGYHQESSMSNLKCLGAKNQSD